MLTLRLVALAAVLAVFALGAADEKKAVEEAERAWAAGITKNDFALLEKVLADDLHYSHSTGSVDTKASYIGNLRSGKMRYNSLEYDSLDVRILAPGVAMTTCRTRLNTASDGAIKLALLHVFRKKGNQWQLVAHQSARMQ